MRDKTLPSFAIVAFNGNIAREHMLAQSTGLGFKLLRGVYTHKNGQKVEERSYLFTLPSDEGKRDKAMANLLSWAEGCHQESILLVDSERLATLVYLADNSKQPLGTWKEVSKARAEACPSYSEHAGRYWICE